MSSFYHYNTHQHAASNAHSAPSYQKNRRAPRLSQNSHNKQFRTVRKEEDAIVVTTFRQRFEAGRSFDLDDDLEFCPNLLSVDDMDSLSGSDRSSLSSESPESSPSAHHTSPDSTFHLNSNSAPYIPASYQSQPTTLKLHQPVAARVRNAIPIVNPSTGINISSPPSSVSPSRMQNLGRRW